MKYFYSVKYIAATKTSDMCVVLEYKITVESYVPGWRIDPVWQSFIVFQS